MTVRQPAIGPNSHWESGAFHSLPTIGDRGFQNFIACFEAEGSRLSEMESSENATVGAECHELLDCYNWCCRLIQRYGPLLRLRAKSFRCSPLALIIIRRYVLVLRRSFTLQTEFENPTQNRHSMGHPKPMLTQRKPSTDLGWRSKPLPDSGYILEEDHDEIQLRLSTDVGLFGRGVQR